LARSQIARWEQDFSGDDPELLCPHIHRQRCKILHSSSRVIPRLTQNPGAKV
jgi:hypothetical protein